MIGLSNWVKWHWAMRRDAGVGKEGKIVSWNKSRFSQWEVEGEVRQRVGKALAEAEQGRVASQCQSARERSAIARAICSLADRVGAGQEAVRAWRQALQEPEKGAEEAQGTG